ncbi:MAG: phosphotransferase [Myxococcota bacterium]
MTAPWLAERELTPREALALITSQHPTLAASTIERLGAGWDNTAFLVDDAWVFRFPRREVAVESLVFECRVLPAIADALPLPIPVPQWIGEPTEQYPWPFAGYRHLSGRTACQADLSLEQRDALATPLAEFLVALHALSPPEAPADTRLHTDTARLVPKVREYLATAVNAGLIDGAAPWEPLLELAHPALPPREHLVHGDIYVRHLLVDEAGSAVGIIDWGDVHRGHPGLDLSVAFSLLPPRSRESFRRAYGAIDDEAWTLARQRGLLYGAVLTAFGHETDDEALVREGRRALRWVLE